MSVRSYRPLFLELVRMFAGRLRQAPFARVARVMSVGLTLWFTGWVITLRVTEGPYAATAKLGISAARMAFWVVAFALALAASSGRTLADRRDGAEFLAFARGASARVQVGARACAAAWLALRWMLLPVATTAIASLASSGSAKVMRDRAFVLAATSLYTFASALLLGPLAALSDSASPRRGRSLFVFGVVATALVAEVARDPRMSLTGALGWLLAKLLFTVGLGALA
ncbi:MAG: hypothetical protein U0271_04425 [Polyangiaceae bacterium]